jgi:hypothetical protein
MHWSYSPDPNCKGNYRRRIEDIQRALDAMKITTLPTSVQFVAYFFGCEKLANGMTGIGRNQKAKEAYAHFSRINLADLKLVATKIGVTFPVDELQFIFAGPKDPKVPPPIGTSARLLRNDLAHDFGPTKLSDISKPATSFFIPKMIQFLNSSKEVVHHLERTWTP